MASENRPHRARDRVAWSMISARTKARESSARGATVDVSTSREALQKWYLRACG